YAESAGSLSLSHSGGTLEIPLMVTHIVTVDVVRFGRASKVRELTLRAAGSGAPRIELFASLLDTGGDLIDGAHDPTVLLQTELPLVQRGRLGTARSQVYLDGATPSRIVTGNFMLTDLVDAAGTHREYTAEGRIEVQVETARGIDLMTGKWSGRLVWDDNPGATTGT
ncbi:MAG TPA: hypothetical protein VHZ95_18670, partial [Polyangiales bacterium]|nr:hypothetical protein [Polyangiales bacterium]